MMRHRTETLACAEAGIGSEHARLDLEALMDTLGLDTLLETLSLVMEERDRLYQRNPHNIGAGWNKAGPAALLLRQAAGKVRRLVAADRLAPCLNLDK